MIETIEALLQVFMEHGVVQVFGKQLTKNNNPRNQLYLAKGSGLLNEIFAGRRDVSWHLRGRSTSWECPLDFALLEEDGSLTPVSGASLLYYPSHQEVRLSAFTPQRSNIAREYLYAPVSTQHIPDGQPDGRVLFLGVGARGQVIACFSAAESSLSREFAVWCNARQMTRKKALREIPLPARTTSTKALLLEKLGQIRDEGWQASMLLGKDGERRPYAARNGAGYTLEALFGIVPNSDANADFMGWELKAYSGKSSAITTLMTPEPDGGFYGEHGVAAFVATYGRMNKAGQLYFTGKYQIDHPSSRRPVQTLSIHGFDADKNSITNVDGGLQLHDNSGVLTAAWSFRKLLDHWSRKHSSTAYVPYLKRDAATREYCFHSPVLLGEGTTFEKFLSTMQAGHVFYDPGSKLEQSESGKSRAKSRNQFRISIKNLSLLYNHFEKQDF